VPFCLRLLVHVAIAHFQSRTASDKTNEGYRLRQYGA